MKIRGIEIELHPNEDFSNHIRRETDFFESEILDFLQDYHHHQDIILDIGANIGNHSVFFANFLSYTSIICFEPILANFELLKRNMAPYENIGLVNSALGDFTGELHMSPNFDNMGAGHVDTNGDIIVKTTSLDRLHIDNVSLMKIDVEEHEPEVLMGAKETIFRCHPLILIEDWHDSYAALLPDYELEKGWPHHQTFLYKWRIQ